MFIFATLVAIMHPKMDTMDTFGYIFQEKYFFWIFLFETNCYHFT